MLASAHRHKNILRPSCFAIQGFRQQRDFHHGLLLLDYEAIFPWRRAKLTGRAHSDDARRTRAGSGESTSRRCRLSGSARETFLRQECQGADDIRAEIERLLSAHENIPDLARAARVGTGQSVCRSRSSEARGPPAQRLHPDPRDRPGRYGLGLSRRAIRRNVPPPGRHQADIAPGRLRRASSPGSSRSAKSSRRWTIRISPSSSMQA